MKKLSTNFVSIIPWKEIESEWGKAEYKRFVSWMVGQTVSSKGVYITDVLCYAHDRNKGIKDVPLYD